VIELIRASALATVQDQGRFGCLKFGVGNSGAMDQLALAAGNLLLGNAMTDAAVELQVFPMQWRFHEPMRFALTGADTQATLNGRPLPPWWVSQASRGDCLDLRRAVKGSRAYLCLPGGIDVPTVLGSRSTQLRGSFGGMEGRFLRQGDRLSAIRREDSGCVDIGIVPPACSMPLGENGLTTVRVLPASEYACYDKDTQAAFWTCEWKITSQSDRYGYRLSGESLLTKTPLEVRSHGIVPGVIQVPPGGQPIIQMRDAQPTGGYPKLGAVIEADLWRLGQAPIGTRLRFVEVTYDEAVAALAENRVWLQTVKRLVGVWAGRGPSA
jgi:5-oxoprolinase (ATP-hydrolysing) subunit C